MKRSNKKEHFCSLKLLAANRENAGACPSIQAGPAATLGVRNPKFHIPQGCLCASAGMVRSGWHLKPGWGVHQGRREGRFSAGSQLWLQRISPKRSLPLFLLRFFPPRVRAVHAEPALSCEFTPRNQKQKISVIHFYEQRLNPTKYISFCGQDKRLAGSRKEQERGNSSYDLATDSSPSTGALWGLLSLCQAKKAPHSRAQ